MTTKKRSGPGPVIRIRMERKDGKWRVVKRVWIPEMVAPPSEDLPGLERSVRPAGFWFDAVDPDGSVIYRHTLREPQRGVELFEDDGSISRVDADTDDYSLDIVIPDLPEIRDVQLFLEEPERVSADERAAIAKAPQPVAVFPARADASSEDR